MISRMGDFGAVLGSLESGFPVLVAQLCVTLVIWLLAFAVVFALTPYKSLATIRAGNIAVSLCAGGSALALAIPLAVCLAGSVNAWDIILWGLPIVMLQMAAYWVTELIMPHLGSRLEHEDIAAALFLVLLRLGFACINAAAISS